MAFGDPGLSWTHAHVADVREQAREEDEPGILRDPELPVWPEGGVPVKVKHREVGVCGLSCRLCPTYYTVGELRDCSGACHIYTDSSLSTISDRRNGNHRVSDGGFD